MLDREEFKDLFWSLESQIYLIGNIVACFVLYFFSYKIIKATTPERKESKSSEPLRETSSHSQNDSFLDSESQGVIKSYKSEARARKRSPSRKKSMEDELVAENSDEELMSESSTNSETGNAGKSLEKAMRYSLLTEEQKTSCFADPKLRVIPLIAYPYIGAFMGSISTCMVRVITGFYVKRGNHTGFDWIYILPGFMIIFCALMSYLIVNKGLKAFDSVYVAPLFKIGAMIASLTTGGVLLNEFEGYRNNQTNFVMFIIGCAICLLGIILLVMGSGLGAKKESDDVTRSATP